MHVNTDRFRHIIIIQYFQYPFSIIFKYFEKRTSFQVEVVMIGGKEQTSTNQSILKKVRISFAMDFQKSEGFFTERTTAGMMALCFFQKKIKEIL